jgi:hypothetical protein
MVAIGCTLSESHRSRWTAQQYNERVTCSPKAGPVTMRVRRPEMSTRRILDEEETHPTADRPHAARDRDKAGRRQLGPRGLFMRLMRFLRSCGVGVLVWVDDSRTAQGLIQRTKRRELTVLLCCTQTPKRVSRISPPLRGRDEVSSSDASYGPHTTLRREASHEPHKKA